MLSTPVDQDGYLLSSDDHPSKTIISLLKGEPYFETPEVWWAGLVTDRQTYIYQSGISTSTTAISLSPSKQSTKAKAPGLDRASSVLLVCRCSSHIGQPRLDNDMKYKVLSCKKSLFVSGGICDTQLNGELKITNFCTFCVLYDVWALVLANTWAQRHLSNT